MKRRFIAAAGEWVVSRVIVKCVVCVHFIDNWDRRIGLTRGREVMMPCFFSSGLPPKPLKSQ